MSSQRQVALIQLANAGASARINSARDIGFLRAAKSVASTSSSRFSTGALTLGAFAMSAVYAHYGRAATNSGGGADDVNTRLVRQRPHAG